MEKIIVRREIRLTLSARKIKKKEEKTMSNGFFDASSYVVKANRAARILTIRFRQNRFRGSNGRAIVHRIASSVTLGF